MNHIRMILLAMLLVITVAVLFGCAATERIVYVQKQCEEQIPTREPMPTKSLPAGVDVFVWVRAAIAELFIRDAYEDQLSTALYNCVTR